MLEKFTSVKRNQLPLVGGDWIISENNANESIINLNPEFMFQPPYRGNFAVSNNNDALLNVYDTTFVGSDESNAPDRSGTVTLRWQKIIQSGETYYSIPCGKTADAPSLSDFKVNKNGWLLLQMKRVNSQSADVMFSDDYLGNVALDFKWIFKESIPTPESSKVYLAAAGVIFDEDAEIAEVVQQQFGPAELWIPLEVSEQESSSSSNGSESSTSGTDSGSSNSESGSSSSNESSSSRSESESGENSESKSGENSESKSGSLSFSISHDDSSSGDDGENKVIRVTFYYREDMNARDTLDSPNEIYRYRELALTGEFTANSQYPEYGYQVLLTGTEYYNTEDGDFEEEIVHTMTVFKDGENAIWTFYDYDAEDWGDWYDKYDEYLDKVYETPVYEHPAVADHPVYPLGNIRVDHHIVQGTTELGQLNDLQSSLIINFAL
ncbi:MAG: hypothetical protein E7047_06250 [Lentisphaerae bacterium]|nr:hypothetical protein [Lentisphaerota bacterium]